MKTNYITTIILEGVDGVGKSTMIDELFKIYNYRYMIYHRGEMSNLLYSMKYHRPPSMTQVNMPCLHVLITCDKHEVVNRLFERSKLTHESVDDINKELAKFDDQDKFIELAHAMSNDYHVIIVNTTGLSVECSGKIIASKIDEYVESMNANSDVSISQWNSMYEKACKKLSLKFSVNTNQPYINDIAFMSESTLQNGVYETFSDKSYPDNLIYSLAYDKESYCLDDSNKTIDFAYIIWSKVNRRPELNKYWKSMLSHNKTCLVSNNTKLSFPDERFYGIERAFGNDFIRCISSANATIYCSRDLAYLKLQTARLYEAIIARQVVFVDKLSDTDCEILSQIHDDKEIIELLYCDENDVCDKYDIIMSDVSLRAKILGAQSSWYEKLKQTQGGLFNE